MVFTTDVARKHAYVVRDDTISGRHVLPAVGTALTSSLSAPNIPGSSAQKRDMQDIWKAACVETVTMVIEADIARKHVYAVRDDTIIGRYILLGMGTLVWSRLYT